MAVVTKKSQKHPHIEWIDLNENGVFVECAIMKRDRRGNIYFIRMDRLDSIDLTRLFDIVSNRNAKNYELWDLMSQITLGNGINSLAYFHQMVEMITTNGQIMKPRLGVVGAGRAQTTPVPSAAPKV